MPIALPPTLIEADKVNTYVRIPVGPFDHACVQVAVKTGGSATGATYTVKRSVDEDIANAQGLPLPCVILGSGVTRPIRVTGHASLFVVVTAADGTAGKVNVSAFGN